MLANAGIQVILSSTTKTASIPACAGMTTKSFPRGDIRSLLVILFPGRKLALESADDGALAAIPEALDICESRPAQPFQLFRYRGCHAI